MNFMIFNFFNKKSFTFLCYMVREARLRKKNKPYIILDSSEKNLHQKHSRYLTEVVFKNLRILELSFNFIGPIECFYLSQGPFPNLKSLNLDCNKIGNEGLNHISYGFFPN